MISQVLGCTRLGEMSHLIKSIPIEIKAPFLQSMLLVGNCYQIVWDAPEAIRLDVLDLGQHHGNYLRC